MNLDLARWQFAITTVYHLLSVSLTIGLSLLVGGMQTAWVRTDDQRYPRSSRISGRTRGASRAEAHSGPPARSPGLPALPRTAGVA